MHTQIPVQARWCLSLVQDFLGQLELNRLVLQPANQGKLIHHADEDKPTEGHNMNPQYPGLTFWKEKSNRSLEKYADKQIDPTKVGSTVLT